MNKTDFKKKSFFTFTVVKVVKDFSREQWGKIWHMPAAMTEIVSLINDSETDVSTAATWNV